MTAQHLLRWFLIRAMAAAAFTCAGRRPTTRASVDASFLACHMSDRQAYDEGGEAVREAAAAASRRGSWRNPTNSSAKYEVDAAMLEGARRHTRVDDAVYRSFVRTGGAPCPPRPRARLRCGG